MDVQLRSLGLEVCPRLCKWAVARVCACGPGWHPVILYVLCEKEPAPEDDAVSVEYTHARAQALWGSHGLTKEANPEILKHLTSPSSLSFIFPAFIL